jgi:hypothetical protein
MSKPKVLFYDLETSYIITEEYKWGIWDERPIEQHVIQDWQVLTIAWKWLGEKKIYCLGQDDYPDYVPGKINDKSLLESFWDVIQEADVIVAHNGDQFDAKKLRTRMIIQGLQPYSPTKQYDTKKAYKRVGAFTSNKLIHLATDTGSAAKGDPGGFKTWKGCVAGEPKAWAHMKKYNKQDIPPLEGLYTTIVPWDPQAPSLNVLADKPNSCTVCLGTSVIMRGLTAPTKSGTRRHRYVCTNPTCGKWMQGRTIIRSEPLLV